ncbi:hypothetical protein TSTA_031300 [Talaromyces stipitatus ATCC 10500]|uniref:Uncharacterized protein n=1 Tax=Talaromyces stipitatus (strain ATCC 10500 / CBS 375.48 / QM 6759 / NRRL 1006) TaxID=441959 RepID=B8M7Z1_TALSN|nr:uncharacterized protein TSTA_031300 [Talaromyces stipitatus ATCC 10500]EED19870.1 hypothetical protein TSTA_031300 [Talaromyces stipitatus ATCC 10500]
MLRTPPTQISLSEYEVLQTIQSIYIQKAMSLSLKYYGTEGEGEAEYYYDSSCTSPSTEYTTSEYDKLACEVVKHYHDAKIYLNSLTPGSRGVALSDSDLSLSDYPAQLRAILSTRTVGRIERDDSEEIYENATEIPESTQASSTPLMEPSAETSPPATTIHSPRSPDPTPRARRVSRVHRSGHHGIVPVLQVQVPYFHERISDMLLSDYMAEWQSGPPGNLRDTYSRLPLRRDQQSNWGRYVLGQLSKDTSRNTEVQSAENWQDENICPTTHPRSRKSLLLEVIDQNDEERDDEESQSGAE